jgi:PilZ domain-containing protein
MSFRMRQGPRTTVHKRAWISVGDGLPLRNCTLIDISDSGAKLSLKDADNVPDTFSLWLSRHGHPRYSCKLVWSGQTTVGVEFSSG